MTNSNIYQQLEIVFETDFFNLLAQLNYANHIKASFPTDIYRLCKRLIPQDINWATQDYLHSLLHNALNVRTQILTEDN